MDRRTFSAQLTSALVLAATRPAQAQPDPRAVIGFLRSTPEAPFVHLVRAFREGLAEAGLAEGPDVTIEYRWADNVPERLPAMAADLVVRRVAVIVGNSLAAEAAKRVTRTVPIVFVTSDDPVQRGLVKSLAKPGGNATGITFFGGGQLGAKRLELLHEIAPAATTIAFLMHPAWPGSAVDLPDVIAAARRLGLRVVVARAGSAAEIEPAFAAMAAGRAEALVVGGSPLFSSVRKRIVTLAAERALPAIYDIRDYVADGGLACYAASLTDAYRRAGIYAGRIVRGAAPADLPVLQPTTFELVLNLRTAKALGLAVPSALLLRADEVIE